MNDVSFTMLRYPQVFCLFSETNCSKNGVSVTYYMYRHKTSDKTTTSRRGVKWSGLTALSSYLLVPRLRKKSLSFGQNASEYHSSIVHCNRKELRNDVLLPSRPPLPGNYATFSPNVTQPLWQLAVPQWYVPVYIFYVGIVYLLHRQT